MMSPELWLRIQTVFNRAIDLDKDDRGAFLDVECGNDGTLREQVASLILAFEKSDENIRQAIAEEADSIGGSVIADRQRIGSYRIVRELGRGGMGSVYLAVRDDDEFHKQVAIKTVRNQIGNDEILRRFKTERQILANLDHPNIARLLDGGTTNGGTPYVVMEYVDGCPLDTFCDQHGLTTKLRLELFLKVCKAVSYAHRSLVIHRDIKPSNILVSEDGTPKLLDFGIAKLLDEESLSSVDSQTRTGVRLMTPEYASPEQARARQVTTASDVYSLGVVLFELLTGHRPYEVDSAAPDVLDRIISESHPPRPSTAVTRDREIRSGNDGSTRIVSAQAISERRSVTTDKLKRQLSGDLDNIILMALRKEPERRYSSVEHFSEDIIRHLSGLPVVARHDTLGYRAGKFIHRHSAAVATTAVVLILIAGLVSFYTWRLAQERNRALAESAKSEQVSQFLTELFAASDPRESSGEKLTSKEVLDSGAARIQSELAGQPEVQSALLDVMGVAYQNLGLHDTAKPLLEKALQIRRGLYGELNKDTAQSLNHLASLYIAKRDFTSAAPLYREALKIERQLSSKDNAEIADLLNNMAEIELFNGNLDESERLYREALTINRQVYGPDHREIATNLSNLGAVMARRGNTDSALDYLKQGMEMRRRVLGNWHPDLAYSLNNVAAMLYTQDRLMEAEPLYRESLEIRRRALGEENPTYCNTASNLALLLIDQGKLDEADKMIEHVLATFKKTLPFAHEDNARALLYKGMLLLKRGEPVAAEPFLRDALQIQKRVLVGTNWRIAITESALGECLATQRKYDEAEHLLVRGYQVVSEHLGPNDKRRKSALARVTKLYHDWKKPERAAEFMAINEELKAR